MRAGRLRHRIAIQERVIEADSGGNPVYVWNDFATAWAAFEVDSGKKSTVEGLTEAETSVKFIMRYQPDITAAMRVSYDGSAYEIQSVFNQFGTKRELHLNCIRTDEHALLDQTYSYPAFYTPIDTGVQAGITVTLNTRIEEKPGGFDASVTEQITSIGVQKSDVAQPKRGDLVRIGSITYFVEDITGDNGRVVDVTVTAA